ncbi:MAG TPA: hypothetical protein DCL54_17090 [Alphaproteobacteria bacterium]|nr:hypothetical protein [Alphaproteobacteria bacterium]HAJ48292.1 hypothetical protein [Alphaproteobacteria bacterium]
MNIALKLTAAQEAWIEAAAARGAFATPEEALTSIIDHGIVALDTEPDDDKDEAELAFVRARLAEAEDDIAHGRILSREDSEARIAALIE